jgi:xylulose-5-phosphate/fructose-6-phosphate phosphoketolase
MLMHEAMATALDKAIFKIKEIQHHSQNNDLFQRPRWPMIILNSPEGKGC